MILRTVIILSLIISNAVAQNAAPEFTKIQSKILIPNDRPASVGVMERFEKGQNLQALLVMNDAQYTTGTLLNPASVKFQWNDHDLESYVYYRIPNIALAFAFPDVGLLRAEPKGELSMTASLIGSDQLDGGWRLPLEFTPESLDRITAALKNTDGRAITLKEKNGNTIAGGYVMGQRREDIIGKSGPNGKVILTAPTRSSAGPHYAWAPGFSSIQFDPMTSTTLTLEHSDESEITDNYLDLTIEDITEDTSVLLSIQNRKYVPYTGPMMRIYFPENNPREIVILSPGKDIVSIMEKPGMSAVRVPLKRTESKKEK